MTQPVPLTTKLSQLLVAFTIELDNEFEHRMPHSTTVDGGKGPWLVSLAMWANYLRLIPPDGLRMHQLAGPYGLPKMAGLQRWHYLVVEPDPADPRKVPPAGDWLVRPTRSGQRAQEIWRPLPAEIEQRWRERFGDDVIGELRASLQALGVQLDDDLPHYPPVVGFGLSADSATPHPGPQPGDPDLSVLLSQPLVAFTWDFEDESPLSLAICADVLRVIGPDGVRVGDLPALGGVSKEAVSMATGYLESTGHATVGPVPSGAKGKWISLTSKGSEAKDTAVAWQRELEQQWEQSYGAALLDRLCAALDAVLEQSAKLAEGLKPYEDGWRNGRHYRWQTNAMLADPLAVLPHHPMVLHRGGYPDGS